MFADQLYAFGDKRPQLHPTVYVADGAKIIGDVHIQAHSSIWFNVVVRGDVDAVRIGAHTNIQDGCVLHEDAGFPLIIHDEVTVGHGAILHGCQVDSGVMVGMGAIILNGARIGSGAVVAAGALVPPGKEIPPGTLAVGSPAKVVRQLTEQEKIDYGNIARRYSDRAQYLRDSNSSSDVNNN